MRNDIITEDLRDLNTLILHMSCMNTILTEIDLQGNRDIACLLVSYLD